MLVVDFNKNNYAQLMKLITNGKKIFLLCYTNDKQSVEVVNEWFLLQVLKRTIPSNDVILAKIVVEPTINILRLFPRIQSTGTELPRVIFINGMKTIEKYTGTHYSKNYITWINSTLAADSNTVAASNYQIVETDDDNENLVIDISEH
jgi:hypothetical protein